MQKEMSILGVGSPIVDTIALVDEQFVSQIEGEKGGMVLIDAAAIEDLAQSLPTVGLTAPGGSAGNTTFALARMGASTGFLGKTGNCGQGGFYRDAFTNLGGDASRFKIGQIPNGRCISLVTPDGERTMRTDLGAAMTLTPEEISVSDFEGSTHAHIEGYLLFNEALMRKVLRSAKEAGCSISLDMASFEVVNATKPILPEILRDYVDIIFANEEEGEAFTGISDDYSGMALRLAEFASIAAIKVGAHGSYIAHKGEVERIEPMHAARVVDTTGAGDLWAAGFLYGWSQQRTLAECGRIGSILGAAVVQEQGSVLPEHVWDDILAAL
ncbi:MAG: adenosine kinase [Verrucomicrobia bacterium]|jgi:sugar/nucleoside kinase (ribokinase family)|nr:adenosine kinase [Verrucomicrobiota bacterium]